MKIYYISKKRTIDLSPSRIAEAGTPALMALAPMAVVNEALAGGIELAGDFCVDLAITAPFHALLHLIQGTACNLNCHPTLTAGMLKDLAYYFPQVFR